MSLSSDGTVMTMPVQPANTSNNNGFGSGNGAGAVDGYILTSDFANIERKIDVVNNGLCDGFYAQAQLVNGVQNAMQQGFMSAEISRANQQAAFMQQLFAMQMQQANCCCETREAIQGVNYNLATQACDTRQTIQNGTRDIIENQNANARAVLDALTAQRIEAKDAKIAEQNQQLFAAQLAASQAAQNETLKAYMSGQLAYYALFRLSPSLLRISMGIAAIATAADAKTE